MLMQMDMKTDDESGQDNGDDDNLFHLSPEVVIFILHDLELQ